MTPEHFKHIRTSLGLSLAQLAAIIRIDDIRTIRRYERGERSVSGPITVLMEMLEAGELPAHRMGAALPNTHENGKGST